MCAPRSRKSLGKYLAVLMALSTTLVLGACSNNTRTGSTFCQRLQEELPGISQPIESQTDVRTMVSRYKRLLNVAPLSIEEDFRVFVALIDLAASSNPNDPDSLQEVADAAYAANTSALRVAAWVYDTCAVDLPTGMNVAPPRTPPPPTVPPDPDVSNPETDPPGSEPTDIQPEG
jgi:hypothetical protein